MGIFLLLFEKANKIFSDMQNQDRLHLRIFAKFLATGKKKSLITYFSSFIAICKGSVSPSSSTMTGAHMLFKQSEWNQGVNVVISSGGFA